MGEKPVFYGGYWLHCRLAKGGMAELFLATPTEENREEDRIVVKRLLPQFSEEEEFLRMFLQEARISSQLAHPNIVRIFDLGFEAGHLFMAMEFIDGKDLESVTRPRRKVLTPAIAAYICIQICDALEYAHRASDLVGRPLNVVHRDVTPENVMITRQGAVKLVDFGVAKATAKLGMTRPGVVKGKLSYMAPEHIQGKELDGRADLFSLGATLYEVTTGIKPFERPQLHETIGAILRDKPPSPDQINPSYPPALAAIVMRALEKDRDRRFPSAKEMQAELERFLASTGQRVGPADIGALVDGVPVAEPRPPEEISLEDQTDPAVSRRPAGGRVPPPRPVPLPVRSSSPVPPPPASPLDQDVPTDRRQRPPLPSNLGLRARPAADDFDEGMETSVNAKRGPEPEVSRALEDEPTRLGIDADPQRGQTAPEGPATPASFEDRPTVSIPNPPTFPAPAPLSEPELPRFEPPPPAEPPAREPPRPEPFPRMEPVSPRLESPPRMPAPRFEDSRPPPPRRAEPARHDRRRSGLSTAWAIAKPALIVFALAGAVWIGRFTAMRGAEPTPTPAPVPAPTERQLPPPPPPTPKPADPVAEAPDAGAEPAAAPAAAPDSGPSPRAEEEKGFSWIAVQGKGQVFIDDKPCDAPCATRVPAGEHVVRSGTKKKVVFTKAGARETVTMP